MAQYQYWIENLIEKDQRFFEWLTNPLEEMGSELRLFLRVVSHLGDGHLWAMLAFWLLFTQGQAGSHAFVAGAFACLGSLALFKVIKNRVHGPGPDPSTSLRVSPARRAIVGAAILPAELNSRMQSASRFLSSAGNIAAPTIAR